VSHLYCQLCQRVAGPSCLDLSFLSPGSFTAIRNLCGIEPCLRSTLLAENTTHKIGFVAMRGLTSIGFATPAAKTSGWWPGRPERAGDPCKRAKRSPPASPARSCARLPRAPGETESRLRRFGRRVSDVVRSDSAEEDLASPDVLGEAAVLAIDSLRMTYGAFLATLPDRCDFCPSIGTGRTG
jgi:hypothetical protein